VASASALLDETRGFVSSAIDGHGVAVEEVDRIAISREASVQEKGVRNLFQIEARPAHPRSENGS